WVPLVEAGELDSARARAAVWRDLAPLLAAGVDELVLGCTHYPFLRPLIEEAAGPAVEVIDPAPAVARQTGRVLAREGWLAVADDEPVHRFYTTGDPAAFARALEHLLGLNTPVEQAAWNAAGTLYPK